AVRRQIAIADRSVRQLFIVNTEIGFENAIVTAQLRRLDDCASRFRPNANILPRQLQVRRARCAKQGRESTPAESEASRDDDTRNGRKSSQHLALPQC